METDYQALFPEVWTVTMTVTDVIKIRPHGHRVAIRHTNTFSRHSVDGMHVAHVAARGPVEALQLAIAGWNDTARRTD